MILPAVVEEGDSAIHGVMNQAYGGPFVPGIAEMMPSKPEGGNRNAGRTRSVRAES